MYDKHDKILCDDVEIESICKIEEQTHTIDTDIAFSDELKSSWNAISKKSDDTKAWIKLAQTFKRQNLGRESIEALSLAIAGDCFNFIYYRLRGHAYLNTYRHNEAIADFKIATRLDPYNYDSWYLMGISYYFLGRYHDSETSMRLARKLASTKAEQICADYWRWFCLTFMKEKEKADAITDNLNPNLKLVTGDAFYQVLLLFKGLRKPEEILKFSSRYNINSKMIMEYGAAQYYYINGNEKEGNKIIKNLLDMDEQDFWPGFAFQAALIERERRNL